MGSQYSPLRQDFSSRASIFHARARPGRAIQEAYMTQRARRRLTVDLRRQELLEAAERVLRQKGLKARVEDIVREAGAAKGTFYLYFSSWDDLLASLKARLYARFDERYPELRQLTVEANWRDVLANLAEGFVDFTLDLGGLHEAIFHSESAQRRPALEKNDAPFQIAHLLRIGQAAGAVWADIDPNSTALLVFAVLHETADAIVAGADRALSMTTLRQFLRNALLVPPRKPARRT
jgi:AcrR family transcriptional regulator